MTATHARLTIRFLAALAMLVLVCSARPTEAAMPVAQESSDVRSSGAPTSDDSRAEVAEGKDRADAIAPGVPAPPRAGTGGRPSRLMRRLRNPQPADIERFLAVARDLNPEWSARLTELRAEDPRAFSEAIGIRGKRLWHLVELRESNPGLYSLRVEEMRIVSRLQSLAVDYHRAVAENRQADVSSLRLQIEATAVKQIDIQMRVRGEELAAMAEVLERLRSELLVEATDRVRRAQELADSIIESPPTTADEDGSRTPEEGGTPISAGEPVLPASSVPTAL